MQAREDATALKEQSVALKAQVADIEALEQRLAAERDEKIMPIGNLVHDSVPVDNDEVRVKASCASSGLTHTRHSSQLRFLGTNLLFVGSSPASRPVKPVILGVHSRTVQPWHPLPCTLVGGRWTHCDHACMH